MHRKEEMPKRLLGSMEAVVQIDILSVELAVQKNPVYLFGRLWGPRALGTESRPNHSAGLATQAQPEVYRTPPGIEAHMDVTCVKLAPGGKCGITLGALEESEGLRGPSEVKG